MGKHNFFRAKLMEKKYGLVEKESQEKTYRVDG